MPARALKVLKRDEDRVMIVNVGREDEMSVERKFHYASRRISFPEIVEMTFLILDMARII